MIRREHGKCLTVVCIIFALLVVGVSAFIYLKRQKNKQAEYLRLMPTPVKALRVGYTELPSAWLLYPLKSLHEVRDISIQTQYYSDPKAMWEQLAANQLDIALTSLDQLALAEPVAYKATIIFPYASSQGSDALVGIKTPPTKIAYLPGTSGYYLAKNSAQAGTSFIPAANQAELLSMLKNGEVSHVATYQPYVQQLVQQGYSVVADTAKAPQLQVMVASQRLMSAYLQPESQEHKWLNQFALAWVRIAGIFSSNERTSEGQSSEDQSSKDQNSKGSNSESISTTSSNPEKEYYRNFLNVIAEKIKDSPENVAVTLSNGLVFFQPAEAFKLQTSLDLALSQAVELWSLAGEFKAPFANSQRFAKQIFNTKLIEYLITATAQESSNTTATPTQNGTEQSTVASPTAFPNAEPSPISSILPSPKPSPELTPELTPALTPALTLPEANTENEDLITEKELELYPTPQYDPRQEIQTDIPLNKKR